MKQINALFLVFCMTAITLSVSAQEVDKATVDAQAKAAASAVKDLKSIDTGEKAWKCTGVIGLNASATGLVNWAAGGKNNVNGVAFAKVRLLYHKNNFAWDTNLDTDFGYSFIDQDEDPLQKTNDKIVLNTKLGYEFAKGWYATVLGGFQSQYAYGFDYITGYNTTVSKWLAPSYTDISVGIDWKPNDIFSLYLSPIAGRITTAWISDKVNNDRNAAYEAAYENGEIADDKYVADYDYRTAMKMKYGIVDYVLQEDGLTYNTVASDKDFYAQFGLSFKGGINWAYKDLKIITTLGLFTPYKWDKRKYEEGWKAGKYVDNRRFGNFGVDWDVAISYQFLKVLNVTLSTSLKYYNGVMIADKNGVEAERVQFKSVLGLGIGYSF